MTAYARLTPPQSRAVLVIAALGTLFCLGVSISPLWQGKADQPRRGAGDVALFRAKVDRIHNGEGYYQAAATEMTARGYPTQSVFNWRTPLPLWLIGKLPKVEWAKYILGALSLGLIVLAFEALAREKDASLGSALGCLLLLSGPLLFSILDNLFVMPVLWAGILIALSICAYGAGKPKLGLALGLAALFIRELALPYCLLSAGIAWRQRQRCLSQCSHSENGTVPLPWELIAWTFGLAAWLLFFGWHCWSVSAMITPDALAHPHGWIRFGGAGFVLATAQMNAYLLLLPPWVTALYFAAALLGLAGWNSQLGTRIGLTVCLYIMAFAVAGQDFNQYWGSIIAPLFCFGVARAPASIRDLWRALSTVHCPLPTNITRSPTVRG
jgi:hypothetical protein